MLRILLVVLLAFPAPLALAHVPPAPVLTCQSASYEMRYHEYIIGHEDVAMIIGHEDIQIRSAASPIRGHEDVIVSTHLGMDGNVGDCDDDPIRLGPVLSPYGDACALADYPPLACGWVALPAQRPLLDYDGEPEHGVGVATLFVETGDGVTSGVAACYGEPSRGHHWESVNVDEWPATGRAPAFTLSADYSLLDLDEGPDCGDGIIQPCRAPRPPSAAPFPVNLLRDAAATLLHALTNEPGLTCDPLDHAETYPAVAGSVNRASLTFGPGADGAYHVAIHAGLAGAAAMGHVWTD